MKVASFLLAALTVAAQPKFEVASVKLTPASRIGYVKMSPPGAATFTAENVNLALLISLAFGVDSDRISAKQGWIESECYDVVAKAERGEPIPSDQLKPMLQQLLVERFKLTFHRGTKDASGYALVVAKDGPKLTGSKGGPSNPMILPGGIRANNATLDLLAGLLSHLTGRPIVNSTRIEGKFDFRLDYAPEAAIDSSLPSVFTALQEQMGLKLVPQKVPVETLIVDHAERVTVEN